MNYALPEFLPGRLVLERGSPADYIAMEQFHYLPKRPATWADVLRIRYSDADDDRIIAVAVLSFPRASCRMRDRFLKRQFTSTRQSLEFVNAHIRAISRVVVHPQFRSLGLSTVLIRSLIDRSPTRYVEAIAMMSRAHPFFERAGMVRVEPDTPDDPIYFIHDRQRGAHVEPVTAGMMTCRDET